MVMSLVLLVLLMAGIQSRPLDELSSDGQSTKPSPLTTIQKSGCFYNGVWYKEGSEIDKGTDGNGWCFGRYCDKTGKIVNWNDFNCSPSTTTETSSPPLITSPPTTGTRLGCLKNSIWYPPGSEISRGSDGEGWCYGEYCTYDGQLQLWDDFNCASGLQPHPDRLLRQAV